MKLTVLYILLVFGIVVSESEGKLPPQKKSYKILMLLAVSAGSHKDVFAPVAEALAERGHKIVMLTNSPNVTNHPNIHEFDHGLPYFKLSSFNLFNYTKSYLGGYTIFPQVLPDIARELYKLPKVKDLYDKRKEFDLIVIDHSCNEVTYPFVHGMPYITINTVGIDPRQSAVYGNVLNPSYVPNLLFGYPLPMSAWQRFVNTLWHIGFAFFMRIWAVVPPVQKEISTQFPDLPPLLELESNQSLTLMNTHFSTEMSVPLLPSQVDIGGIQCRPPKPLPQDLKSWISGAGPEGVIYFSVGSIARGNGIPLKARQAFIEAFRRLPHRVVWKYEEDLEDIPKNVMIRKWLPQQDILGHENVKLFISHCGLLSLHEAIYHATPLFVLPVFADQPRNTVFVTSSGIGRRLDWDQVTMEAIIKAITDITTNQTYRQNIERISQQMRDQLTTPRERAVFWTEYVIRHRGAPQLRSPAAQLSWIEFLMLDVLFFIHVVIFILIFIMKHICKGILTKFFTYGGKKMKRD